MFRFFRLIHYQQRFCYFHTAPWWTGCRQGREGDAWAHPQVACRWTCWGTKQPIRLIHFQGYIFHEETIIPYSRIICLDQILYVSGVGTVNYRVDNSNSVIFRIPIQCPLINLFKVLWRKKLLKSKCQDLHSKCKSVRSRCWSNSFREREVAKNCLKDAGTSPFDFLPNINNSKTNYQ